MARRKRWSYSAGERPHTVVVEEREVGGTLRVRAWDATRRGGKGGWVRRSLGHRDKEAAKAYALEQAGKLKRGRDDLRAGQVTIAMVFSQYLRFRTPRKRSSGEQKSDRRRAELWTRILGSDRDPHRISLAEWETFIDRRLSGAINARGLPVAEVDRRPVGPRTVETNCLWLKWVFSWAARWQTAQGSYLMRENPLRGFETPRELNPQRSVASQDRYEATRVVSDRVMMETRFGGGKREQRSYLSELLDLANGTGHRLSAICSLTFENLRLGEGPYGSIHWPSDTDKVGYEATVPVSPLVRAALDRIVNERPGIGAAPLFPSPGDPTKPMTRHLADKWLRKGEKLAGLEPLRGTLWHSYRRKWATERKHMPDVDVALAGGWKNTVSLKTSYQQADAETTLRVVLGAGELREAQ